MYGPQIDSQFNARHFIQKFNWAIPSQDWNPDKSNEGRADVFPGFELKLKPENGKDVNFPIFSANFKLTKFMFWFLFELTLS